ncbi:PAFAH2 [Symbiodinium microadriaticum]|nr:PAFAH2 [Symbiodinium microadriaticum]
MLRWRKALKATICTAVCWRFAPSRVDNLATFAATSRSMSFTGLPPGPYPVGVTSLQLDDHSRQDPEGGPRSLQTEIWYPAGEEARELPRNRFSEFLGRGTIPGSIEAAEASDAIGGYRSGLTIAELDDSWPNLAVRDARLRDPAQEIGGKPLKDGWPLVIFSHGSGAYRASYIFWTEFLASQGFIVAACDHPGSARYTQVNGRVIKPGGPRSERSQMEADRPLDVLFLLDSLAKLTDGQDSRFAGRVDVNRCALTGMSFGGWTAAAALEFNDPRVKAALLMCPSLMSAEGRLTKERTNLHTPLMVMIGTEDTVIGTEGNALCRDFVKKPEGCSFLMEIKRGGHCSFTSCDLYNPAYGNGIGESKSLSSPGSMYMPLEISKQHEIINGYGLAFLDKFIRGGSGSFLTENHYPDELVYKKS